MFGRVSERRTTAQTVRDQEAQTHPPADAGSSWSWPVCKRSPGSTAVFKNFLLFIIGVFVSCSCCFSKWKCWPSNLFFCGSFSLWCFEKTTKRSRLIVSEASADFWQTWIRWKQMKQFQFLEMLDQCQTSFPHLKDSWYRQFVFHRPFTPGSTHRCCSSTWPSFESLTQRSRLQNVQGRKTCRSILWTF